MIIFFRLGFFYMKLDGIDNLKNAEKWFERSLNKDPHNKDIAKYLLKVRKKIYGSGHSKIIEVEKILEN